jgi:hypothetical protein
VNDITKIVHLRTLDRLLLEEVVRLHGNVVAFQLLAYRGQLLHRAKVLGHDAAGQVWVMLSELESLVTRSATDITDQYSVVDDVFSRQLEVFHRYLIVPDAALSDTLSGHESLPGFGVFGVLLAPFEDWKLCLVCQVKWRLLRWVLVVQLFIGSARVSALHRVSGELCESILTWAKNFGIALYAGVIVSELRHSQHGPALLSEPLFLLVLDSS